MQPPPLTWADVPGYVRDVLACPFEKQADGMPIVSPAADVLGWRAGDINAHWGGPRPVANLLIGSGLGALGGYGIGRLAQEILPERYFDPEKVRRRAALIGAAVGAAYPLYQAYDSVRATDDLSAPFDRYPPPVTDKEAADLSGLRTTWHKSAADFFSPQIPVDDFTAAVMRDTNTPFPLRAATAGLVNAADVVSDRDNWVSPFDIGRIAVGAGVGLVSGTIAGKVLGLLAGLTPQAQQKVQDAGLWYGALKAVVPPALGLGR